jgi:hypothetical protein
MKYKMFTLCAVSLSLFLSQCSENPTIGEENSDISKSIKIAIAIPAGLSKTISNAIVEISAENMKTIKKNLAVNDSSITGVIHNIPAGNDRHFEVSVYGSDRKTVLYYGDTYANIYAGQDTYLKIILRQPGGSAIIDGYIEGYVPPSDTIPIPESPYIYDYQLSLSIPPRCASLTLATSGSVYFDSLYYIWNVTRIYQGDTTQLHSKVGMTWKIQYPGDGEYQVSVQAQSMYDTLKHSPDSYPLFFTIKDGLLTDPVLNNDMTPPIVTLNGPDTIIISVHTAYIEYGATAYDNVDGDLTTRITIGGYIDTMRNGTYLLYYSAIDNSGNTGTAIRTIIITRGESNDTVRPVITLKGDSNLYIAPGDTFVEPGYYAFDNVDGDITSKVKPLIADHETYTLIWYQVYDAAGNESVPVVRHIYHIVYDTTYISEKGK